MYRFHLYLWDFSTFTSDYSNPQKCHHRHLDKSGITKVEVSGNVTQRSERTAGKSIREASGSERYRRSVFDQCERGVSIGQAEGANRFGSTAG